MSESVAVADVVQIAPDARVNEALRGALAFVEEVRPWGCEALVLVPGQGVAPVRLAAGEYARVGRAPYAGTLDDVSADLGGDDE